jgi:hypothetical protein
MRVSGYISCPCVHPISSRTEAFDFEKFGIPGYVRVHKKSCLQVLSKSNQLPELCLTYVYVDHRPQPRRMAADNLKTSGFVLSVP